VAPLAALTGATGFLGRRLVRRFEEGGWRVRLLVRRPADADAFALNETVLGDLADAAALERLAKGADVVVHCAGLIKARSAAEFLAVNAQGCARLAAATRGRMVLISSLAAREPRLSDYAASKHAGETAAREILGERLTVVRPPVIYGPGDRETLTLFRFAAHAPLLPVPAAPAARLVLAHVDDVAVAVLALMGPDVRGGLFAVGGDRPEGYGWREVARAAAAAVGRAPPIVEIPAAGLLAAGRLSGFLARGPGSAPIFTLGKAREMLHGAWQVSAAELAPAAPPARFTLAEGFADAVAWYRREGWLSAGKSGLADVSLRPISPRG
jgi:nucleoside-diphosphate-sugar epimerase